MIVFQERGLVNTVYIPLSSSNEWNLTLEDIEKAYEKAVSEGKRVIKKETNYECTGIHRS